MLLITLVTISSFSIKYVKSGGMHTSENYQTNIVYNGSKQQKNIALTFDDGPHPQYTTEILDLLNEYNIKATFFVLGKFAEQYPDIVKRQASEGHEIGNHTYSHINVKRVSKEKFEEEFNKTNEIIFSLTGIESQTFRPPYGFCDEKSTSITDKNKCNVVLWSFKQDSKDWNNPGIEKIANTILSQIENGDIILLHDNVYHDESHTVEALKIVLPELKKRNYRFVTISELIKLSNE